MTNDQIPIARAIATLAHKGQIDKAGKPYIGHPERVSEIVDGDNFDEDWTDGLLASAWLHDVLEDSFFTADDLAAAGISGEVVATVVALTRIPDERPEAYYARVRDDAWAIPIKRADIEDNTDPRRLAELDDATIIRLVKKYAKAQALLDGDDA